MTQVRRIELGDKLYLFTANDDQGHRPRRLIITSHGGFDERAVRNRASNGWLTVPGWTTLYFYADHGFTLEDPGTRNLLGHRPAEEQGPTTTVQNYVLSKFQERGNGAGVETYDSIQGGMENTHLFRTMQKDGLAALGLDLDAETDPAQTEERLAQITAGATDAQRSAISLQKGQRQVELYDVLTVRKRRLRSDMTLRDVLRKLEEEGYLYPEIHCSFCRSPMRLPFFDRGIPSMPAAHEPRWARTGHFVRKP